MTVIDSNCHKILSQVAFAIPSNINKISYTQTLKLLSVFANKLAFYNPALALMFRPHSTLAWLLYFSESGNPVSQDVIDNNLHEISGFENVGSCEFENTRNGYTVALFGDENKSEKIQALKAYLKYENKVLKARQRHQCSKKYQSR